VVASVLLDRLSGFAGIVIVALVAYGFGFGLIDDKSIAIPIVIMAAASFLVIVVLFNQKVYHFCCQIFDKLPKIKSGLINMHNDILLLNHKKIEGFKAIGLSCLCQIFLAWGYYLVAKALHQDIAMVYFLIFVPIICVAAAFPSIGGLGVREAGAVYLFTKIGVDSGIAVSISLINFFFMVLFGLLGGVIYVTTLSSRRVQHNPSDAGTSAKEAGGSAQPSD